MKVIGEGTRAVLATTADPGLHLLVDGIALAAVGGAADTLRFAVPAGARDIRICSRSTVPAESGLTADLRRLGVHVSRIVVTAADVAIEIAGSHPVLTDGWHDAEGRGRWTNGAGLLPGSMFAGIVGSFEILLQIARTDLRYPLERPRPRPRLVPRASAAAPGFDERAGVALLAASASEEAIRRFAAEAMDFARRLIPGLWLHIYAATAALPAVAGEAIEIHAAAEDPGAALDRHCVLVVPAAAGDGAAQALMDGLASAIPVVAVPELTAAMGLTHEREVLVAADHTGFAMALARLHGDLVLWRRLSQAGPAWASRHASGAPDSSDA